MRSPVSRDAIRALSLEQVIDYLAVRIRGLEAEGRHLKLTLRLTDTGQTLALNLENGALTSRSGTPHPDAQVTLELKRPVLDALATGELTYADAVQGGQIAVTGDQGAFGELLGWMDNFPRLFEIVEPKSE
jgi:alkyl sulfatase BDS1-like metallo-beta-lactamase superfamily hydrolase